MNYIHPRTKLLYHIDRLHELRTKGNTRAPVNVEIDLSNRCSHGCAWCHFAYTHTKGPLAGKVEGPPNMLDCGDLMNTSLLISALSGMRQAGVRSVTWSGGGEPTLHPEFNKIVDYTSTLGLDQAIYTHGGHIDDNRAALLKEEMTFVYVSLDECTAEQFHASKGVHRFYEVCDNIKRLVAADGKATIGVGFLLHRSNSHQVRDMVCLGKILGVDYVQFRPVVAYDQQAPGQQVEDTLWINRAIVNLRQFAGDPFVQADTHRFEQYRDWNNHGYETCYWSAMQTVITPNGQVWRCTNRRGHKGALLGSLNSEPFEAIWRRAGGPCAVERDCRIMCRGHLANLTMTAMMADAEHRNFP